MIPIITPWVEDHLPITVEGQVQFPSSHSETTTKVVRFTNRIVKINYGHMLQIGKVFTWTCRERLSHQVQESKKRREIKSGFSTKQ